MELKVWVEGIQRVVCGVSEKTTCQDVVYALAHATGKTGRFTLIERWRTNERMLAPAEHPVKVLAKWGEYSQDVAFILQRSSLETSKAPSTPKTPEDPRKTKGAIWKPPPSGTSSKHPPVPGELAARLSPDSGKGSDPTGSDTSNFSDQEKALGISGGKTTSQMPLRHHTQNQVLGYPPSGVLPSGYQPQGWNVGSRFHSQSPERGREQQQGYGYTKPRSGSNPPAYRPPPHPGQSRNQSSPPPSSLPPPYRNPPPPPGSSSRHSGPIPTSPTMGRTAPIPKSPTLVRTPPFPTSPTMGQQVSSQNRSHPPPSPRSGRWDIGYSPPPHHRQIPGHPRGPSPGRSHPNSSRRAPLQSPTRGHSSQGGWGGSSQPNTVRPSPPGEASITTMHQDRSVGGADSYQDLINLVSVQQTRLQSQHAEIKQCDHELHYWSRTGYSAGPGASSRPEPHPSQLEAVVSEVKRLEDVAVRNMEELNKLGIAGVAGRGDQEGSEIRTELDQLKKRLELTDNELSKTNFTLSKLGDEMRCFSQEKSRQVEAELKSEVERIQAEIKHLQLTSEEGTNIYDQLQQEVQDVENQISARKEEIENLIQQMKNENLESLRISPPEETKANLDGHIGKVGSTRKMLGSPRELETAVPTTKNPHGVWV